MEIRWNTKDGREVVVRLRIIEKSVSNGWGGQQGTGRYYIVTDYKLAGETQFGYRTEDQLPEAYRAAGVKYAVGKLAVTAENAARIAAAYAELESDPRMLAMREREKQARIECDEYERHTRRMEAVMRDGVK